MKRTANEDLFRIADRQQGYFTSAQAEESGFSRVNFHRKLHSGQWIREQRGIYRLKLYPVTPRSELVVWTLWSRDRRGHIQGTWSHETALSIYELSDVMPSVMHMTVPPGFRRRVPIPSVLQLHFAKLEEFEKEKRQGYQVTTPLRTLKDVILAGETPDELLLQALEESLARGLVLRNELRKLCDATPEIKAKVEELLGEAF